MTYTPDNWPGGFTASVTVSNIGAATDNGWTLAFTFPGDEQITGAWNAAVTQTGATVSATNLSYKLHHRARRQPVIRLPGNLDVQRRLPHRLQRQRHDVHVTVGRAGR